MTYNPFIHNSSRCNLMTEPLLSAFLSAFRSSGLALWWLIKFYLQHSVVSLVHVLKLYIPPVDQRPWTAQVCHSNSLTSQHRLSVLLTFLVVTRKEATQGGKDWLWLTVLRHPVHHGREGMAARARGICLPFLLNQKAEEDEFCHSAPFLFFLQSRALPHQRRCPHSGRTIPFL